MSKHTANFVDKFANEYFPGWGVKRESARMRADALAKYRQLDQTRPDHKSISGSSSLEADEINRYDRQVMVNISRKLVRENPIVGGIIDTFIDNVVTYQGIRPLPNTGHEEFDKQSLSMFMDWTEKADERGVLSFWEYQRILFKTYFSDGAAGTILRPSGELRGIELDILMTPQKYRDRENYSMIQGIQIDPVTQKRQRYWLGQRGKYGILPNCEFTSVPARNFIHTANIDRFSQFHGISKLFASYDKLRNLDDLIDYSMFAAKVQAMFAIALEPKKSPSGGAPSMAHSPLGTKNPVKPDAPAELTAGKGSIIDLGTYGAEKANMLSVNQPGPHFLEFATFIARLVGCSVGLAVDLVLMDFHEGNYSSQRMVFRVAFKSFMRQWSVMRKFNQRVYNWKISNWIKSGELPLPDKIKNNYLSCIWTPPVAESLDPEKEVKASLIAEMAGYTNKEIECIKRGTTLAENISIESKAIKLFCDAGVPFVMSDIPGIKTLQEINAGIKVKEAQAEKFKKESK